MKKIIFVTGNKAKVGWANRRLSRYGIKLIQKKLDIEEPREFEVEKVVLAKAKIAMQKIKKPLIVDDSGFLIKSLKNFPGTYLKLVLKTIGVGSLCKLARKHKDKKTNFKSAIAYVDEKKKIHIFVCNDIGEISLKPKGDKRKGFSDFMKIHIPKGFKKTLAEMDNKEFKGYERKIEKQDHYVKFARWLMKR